MFAISRSAGFATVHVLSRRIPGQVRKAAILAGLGGVVIAGLLGTCAAASAQTATTTTLAVTSGGNPATTVASGSVVTLTAQVNAGATPLTVGQVKFCDATATYCTDIHLLGTAQLTSAGTATLKFRPGIGSRSYKAVFLGSSSIVGSSSPAYALTVTGVIPTLASTTSISETGSWGAYTITGTMTETGNTAPPTGTISFLDTNHGNAVLGIGTLGEAKRDLSWSSSVSSVATSVAGVTFVEADLNGDGIPDLFVKDYFGTYDVLLGNGDGTFTVVGSPFGPSTEIGSFVIGDFNNDGIPDVAAITGQSYASNGAITIFIGNGDGTFTVAGTSPALGYGAAAIAAADINGDGIADLIVSQQGVSTSSNGQLLIFFGKGDGTFTQASSTVATYAIASLIVPADLNGDGRVDLVVTNDSMTQTGVLLGNGDGTFTTVANTGVPATFQFAVADVNNDGIPDLVVQPNPSYSNPFATYLGNGDGTFHAAPASSIGILNESNFAIADFNGDGIPDIAYTTSTVTGVLFGVGDGTFLPSSATATFPYGPAGFVVADFNGDGWPDILTQGNNRTVVDFLNAPTETAAATATASIAVPGSHIADAGYSGDSNYNASTSGTISLWGVPPATTTTLIITAGGQAVSSVGPGTVVTLTAAVSAGASPVTAGQVDFCDASGTDCSDIHLLSTAAVNSGGTAMFKFVPGPGVHSYKAVFVQDGYGLTSASGTQTLTVGPGPSPVYSDTTSMSANGPAGDYTLTATVVGMGGSASPTGNISFVDTSFGNTSLATVALGSATAGAGWLVSQTPAIGSNPLSEVTGDFNGDGIPDLAVLWSTSPYGGPYSVTILFGNGNGTFTTGPTVQPAGVQSSPKMIGGDFNGDGNADLVIVSSAGYVTALPGNGDGTFATPQTGSVASLGVPENVVAADFNGDGKLDLAVTGNGGTSGGVTILFGNGDGTFTAAEQNVDASADFGLIATGDFNGDGIPDLIAANLSENGSSPIIFLGKGDGTFTATSASFTLDYYPASVVVGDFNGDGVLDLAFSDLNGIKIALGKGDGTFQETAASPISVNSTIAGLALGDFNRDGKLDIVTIGDFNGFSQNVLLLGAGDGTFTWNSTILSTVQNSTLPFMAVVGDFNGDGTPDLATLAKNVGTASILLTEPTETATATVSGVAPLGAGIHNVEASYPGDNNYPASVSSIFELTAGVAPPVISPGSGTITSAQSITITDATPGATIYYSAFGALTTNQFVQYTGPIPMEGSGSLQIQAYATETGYQQSQSATANYTLKFTNAAATPVISLASGNYADSQTVTISDVTPGAQIYYLTDGAYPSSYSNLYTGPITVSTSEILTVVALAPGYRASGYATAQYDIATSSSRFIYTIAGNFTQGYTGDGGPATFAELIGLQGIAVDNAGNIYIADGGDNVVREITASTGIITTIAGTGVAGHTGDSGPAASAALWSPTSLAVDAVGNLYIGETGDNVVRLVNAGTGTITTFAGNPTGSGSLGGPANNYALIGIGGIALDYLGANLYIANGINVVEVNTGNGVVSLPTGLTSYPSFGYLTGITVDPGNNIYVSDQAYSVVRKISPTGATSVFAGSLYGAFGGDGGPATSAGLDFPAGLSSDRAGNIYIADEFDCAIREVNTSGIINTVAGVFNDSYSVGGDGSPSNNVGLAYPLDIASDAAGNVYVADQGSGRVRKVTIPTAPPSTAAAAPVFSLSAGTYSGSQTLTMTDPTPGAEIYVTLDGSTPTTAGQGYHGPIEITGTATVQAIALAPGYLASAPVSTTYTITTPPTETISTVVGTGVDGFSSAGGPATSSQIGVPWTVALDSAGNLYVADTGNFVVWMVTAATGDISIVAGTGTQGTGTDGGPATESELFEPYGVAVDKLGNIYITDNTRVRMVAAQTGIITTVAGPGVPSSALGDGGPATSAYLGTASGLAIDNTGNLYIADTYQNRIRMVAAKTGIISTVAGGGTAAQLGDGGLATAAYLAYPTAVTFDSAGNLYIADQGNERIRKVDASTGFITTIAGNGTYGHAGDGGPATQAKIDLTQGIAVDAAGNVYFTDQTSTVREVSATTGIISTLAGDTYFGFGGDGGAATMAELSNPYGLAVDAFGSLYVADTGNSAVRKVAVQAPAPAPVFSPAGGTYVGTQTVTISDSVQGAVIYYTTDGSVPTTASNLYSGSITVSAAETLQAIAVAKGYAESGVTSAAYIINQPVTPTITWATPAAITYGTALSATQLDATSSVAGTFAYAPATGAVLAAGSQTLSVAFTPTDAIDYTTATGSVTLVVNKATPAVTESPSASSITTAQPLTVTITVSGGSSSQTPTGSVSLSGGGYTSTAATLSNGGATIGIPAGSLAVATDALAVTYTPDSSGAADYTTATQSVTVTVTQAIGTATATVTATPSATTITNNQSVTVKTTLSGGSGLAAPTGLVTLTSGSYTSSQALSSGTATFNIAAGSLSSGLNTLTATYSGDAIYAGTSGTTTITVSQVLVSIPAPSAVSPGGSTTATALFTAGSNYSGTMNLACTLATSPSGAQSLPTCSLNPASLTFTAGGSGTTTVTIGTTAASTSALARPHQRNLWGFGQGGALLAMVFVFFVPSRRRGWISMLLLILVIAGAGVIGCGGSGSKTTGTSTPATTAGNYTFTVTGTDTVNSKITVSSTVAVTVE